MNNENAILSVKQQSEKSLCAGRKVACILITEDEKLFYTGVNTYQIGATSGTPIHAEIVALANLGKTDISGGTAYVSYAPCVSCAEALLLQGIKKIICPPLVSDDNWYASQLLAEGMIRQTSTQLIYVDV